MFSAEWHTVNNRSALLIPEGIPHLHIPGDGGGRWMEVDSVLKGELEKWVVSMWCS